MNWPSFFPPQCPPSKAKDACGEVFRVVSSQPPSVNDFECYAQMCPERWKSNCEASGLSVFTTKSDALRLMRRVPALGNLIASGNLSPEAGKLIHTPRHGNSHHTWWAPDGFVHASIFEVVT